MRIPSKFFVSHNVPVGAWARYHALSLYHAFPNAFVKPYRSSVEHVFVCGCGHGGTTLLAAKLGQHSEFLLIGRETGTFGGTVSAHCALRVVKEWDYFAKVSGKGVVLEKTPKHVQFVPKIRKVLPEAKIVVITRNPLDNVSSLYGRFGDLEGCVGRWISDNGAARDHGREPGLHFVKYEDLVTRPKEILSGVVRDLGHAWEDEILSGATSEYAATNETGTMARRADQVKREITRNIGGWRAVLSQEQARYVVEKTRGVASEFGYPAELEGYQALLE